MVRYDVNLTNSKDISQNFVDFFPGTYKIVFIIMMIVTQQLQEK